MEGIGWVMRECSDEVRLGMVSEGSPWSVVPGRSRVDGRMKDGWSLRVGDMAAVERSPGGGGERALGADEDEDDDDGRGEKEGGRGEGGAIEGSRQEESERGPRRVSDGGGVG